MITRRQALGIAAAAPFIKLPAGRLKSTTSAAGYIRGQLETIVAQGVPGALAVAHVPDDEIWAGAGVAELRTGPVRPQRCDRFRVASITKTFVATVVLQLVAEGYLGLDDPIGRYLPGLLPHQGSILIRHLLQHTSGLPDYHNYDGLNSAAAYLAHRDDDPSPYQSIALATAHPLLFTPGTAWSYADTNYLVLGLLIERLTGTSAAKQVSRRLIRLLRLTSTSYPEHTPWIKGAHLHGYMPTDLPGVPFGNTTKLVDFSYEVIDQTGAAGAMISNGPDLLRFLGALLRGHLLPPELMTEMTTTVPVDAAGAAGGLVGYGLGLAEFDAGAGVRLWGNTGIIRGYISALLATRNATRRLAAVATLNPVPDQTAVSVTQAIAAIARHISGG